MRGRYLFASSLLVLLAACAERLPTTREGRPESRRAAEALRPWTFDTGG